MTLDDALGLAREGRLYPSLILHGRDEESRRAAAVELARTVLCDAEPAERPCGRCRHCRRIRLPEEGEAFHPDYQVLERDLKTSTSVAATRAFVQTAQMAPFEARGQVFVVANAETLTGEAANALLKVLEEPAATAPRHFLLLAPSQFDLLDTLRSRSWALYLGPAAELDAARVEELVAGIAPALTGWRERGATVFLLSLAATLAEAGDFRDPRAQLPWSLAAAAVERAALEPAVEPETRRRLLALA
ncbi:MAG: hypothetical protein ACRD2Z_03365, partial [Thermoanaerobaculia bacterium]